MRRILNPWILFWALIIGLLLAGGTLLLLWYSRPGPSASGLTTAVLNVIPAPTVTRPVPSATPSGTATPTQDIPPSPLPGLLAVGAYVQISGTGGDGLRLRSQPGLSGQTLVVGAESEVFRVDEGPQDADGYTWWHLVGLYDESRDGWAASNFLSLYQP